VVWQWQRNRGHRGRNPGGGVADPESAATTGTDGGVPSVVEGASSTAPDGRQSPLSDPAFVAGLRPIPSQSPDVTTGWPASDVVGKTPQGAPVEIVIGGLDGPLLLAFLHTECDGCEEFWRGLADGGGVELPGSVSVAIVTKGPGTIAPEDVQQAARGVNRVPVVMSDRAWTDYRVLGYPFFVLVDPVSDTVRGETVGFGWSDVISMIRAAGD
jgi:hypothetical protein